MKNIVKQFTNLTNSEIDLICHILNSVTFQGFKFQQEVTPTTLSAMKTEFVTKSLHAIYSKYKEQMDDDVSNVINDIIQKI